MSIVVVGQAKSAGATTTALALMPFGIDLRQAVRDLAPR